MFLKYFLLIFSTFLLYSPVVLILYLDTFYIPYFFVKQKNNTPSPLKYIYVMIEYYKIFIKQHLKL